jgi:FMN-dependent NADH-azoreductase
MAHILHIDASPRSERSISRNLSKEFVTRWKAVHPKDTIIYRDLGHQSVPYVDESWIAAAFTPPTEHSPELAAALRTSDELVDELLSADRYVFGVPMYNFNVPAVFKAYIDQIVRAGRTFAVGPDGLSGLVQGKKLLVIAASGSVFRPGTPFESYNFHEPYLRTVFGFIGITDVTFINADGLNGSEAREKSLAEAQAAIQTAIANW